MTQRTQTWKGTLEEVRWVNPPGPDGKTVKIWFGDPNSN